MRCRNVFGFFALIATLGFATFPVLAADEQPEFTQAYLDDPANFEKGKEIWFEQCTHCHGFKAYPGKAPKLKPKRYKPSFVYKRVTKGFRKMPAWEEIYDLEERMAVVAYVMNKKFSP